MSCTFVFQIFFISFGKIQLISPNVEVVVVYYNIYIKESISQRQTKQNQKK